MASLSDTISQGQKKLVKRGGLLTEETLPTNQLAGASGLPAAPTDPASIAALGGTKKQQDMAGTPNQLASANQQNLEPGQSLQDVERRRQANTQQTGQEQQEAQKASVVQGLGGLGGKVQGMINKFLPTNTTANASLVTQVSSALTIPAGKETDVKSAADALVKDPGDQNAMLSLNKALGLPANNTFSPAQVTQLYKDSVSTIAEKGAESTQDNLTVSDLLKNDALSGYSSGDLAALLGEPVDGLTLRQFQDKINNVISTQMQETANNQRIANSSLAGSAERQVAQQVGQDLAASGTASIESQTENIGKQIDRADRVTVGGKQYTVSQLLTDGNIQQMITDYLTNPTSEQSKALASSSPDFAKWIDSNKAALKDAVDKIGAGATKFQETQKTRTSVGTYGGTQLNDTILNLIAPDRNNLSATGIDHTKVPILSYIDGLPDANKKVAVETMNKFVTEFPDLAGSITNLSPATLSKLGFGWDQQMSNKYVQAIRANRAAAQNHLSESDPDALVKTLSGGSYGNTQDLQKQYDQARTLNAIQGGTANTDQFKLFDANNDGIIDSPAQLASRANVNQLSLGEIISNVEHGKSSKIAPKFQPLKPIPGFPALSKLADAAKDGKVTDDEINNSGITVDELQSITLPSLKDKIGLNLGRNKYTEVVNGELPNKPEDLDKMASDLEKEKDRYGTGAPFVQTAADSLRQKAKDIRYKQGQDAKDANDANAKQAQKQMKQDLIAQYSSL